MKFKIGSIVADEEGNSGKVVIKWDDGDICDFENDAAHPNPIIVGHGETYDDSKALQTCSGCSGTGIGRADDFPCWRCHGRGWVDSRPNLDDDYEINLDRHENMK